MVREDRKDGAGEARAYRTADGLTGARESADRRAPLERNSLLAGAEPRTFCVDCAAMGLGPARLLWEGGVVEVAASAMAKSVFVQLRGRVHSLLGWSRCLAGAGAAGGQPAPAAPAGSGGAGVDAGAAAGGPRHCRAPSAGVRPNQGSLPPPPPLPRCRIPKTGCRSLDCYALSDSLSRL